MNICKGITIPFFLIFSIFFAQNILAEDATKDDNVVLIAGYVTPAPAKVLEEVADRGVEKPVVGGIHMTYSGYRNFTNRDGYFSFPKHHPSHELRVIITTRIGYDLYKNTVSRQELPDKKPPIAVYRIQKLRESAQTTQTAKPASEYKRSYRTNAPKAVDENQWMWKVKLDGKTPPAGGITSHDLVIFADPQHFYLQDGSTHFAEESNQFVFPHNLLYLLSTPKAADLDHRNRYMQSVDIKQETDTTGGSDGDKAAPPTQRAITHASGL